MTLKELSQLYYLNREIELDKNRLEDLRSKAFSIQSTKYTDMPKSSTVRNAIEDNMAEITELEEIIQHKIARCTQERNRLEKYIANIPDSLTRQIFTLRFINGLPWVSVAWHIGGNTEQSVKMICYRYINSHKK